MKRKAVGGAVRKGFASAAALLVLAILVGGSVSYYAYLSNPNPVIEDKLPTFDSCTSIASTFRDAQQKAGNYYFNMRGGVQTLGAPMATDAEAGASKSANAAGVTYSDTNVQVAGVDEADIVKTDGEYIYTVTSGSNYGYVLFEKGYAPETRNSTLVIARGYPADQASVLSQADLGDFYPQEMFIQDNYVLIFGSTSKQIPYDRPLPTEPPGAESGSGSSGSSSGAAGVAEPSAAPPSIPDTVDTDAAKRMIAPEYYPPYRYLQLSTVRIYDVSDKASPSLVRSVDFEGNYLSSRKIGSDVYFVVNSYPDYWIMERTMAGAATDATLAGLLPAYRDRSGSEVSEDTEFSSTSSCNEVAYFEPVNPQNFITIASISLDDPQAEVVKEVIMGSGESVYASASSLYIAETNYPYWYAYDEAAIQPTEKTLVHKFSLEGGQITHVGQMEAPGHVLNQFSMDEYDGHFRIATTVGQTWSFRGEATTPSRNNVYVFGSDMQMTGKLEDVAPGETIYSARFMGGRGYLVTFKKIDPFFVLDLSDHSNPRILGKLKIPGYSDYLHPYDENHVIGIGKEAVDAESEEGMPSDFAWYQGVKMAVFDVTDVANPVEMHKVVIGDRGTDSYALHDHKAFLFDREKNLLVVPILLAEMTDAQKQATGGQGWEYGEYKFQGAYVYDLTLENGFQFKGRITHYDSDEPFLKSGYYYFDDNYSVKRSLYIGDVLYTVSGMKIKLNSLADLAELKELAFGQPSPASE